VRIITGSARGVRLASPRSPARIRPTSDRVREAIFSVLTSAGALGDGGAVLDLFSGTGALGLEALSRGAARAVLLDREPEAVRLAEENARRTGLGDRVRVLRREAGAFLRSPPRAAAEWAPFDLVFLDPPYDCGAAEVGRLLDRLAASGLLAAGATVVLERRAGTERAAEPAGFEPADERRWGGTSVSFLTTRRPGEEVA